MTEDVDLRTVAVLVHRSYSWLGRNWRTYRHPGTGELFPRPFVGAELGQRPWWRRAAIEAWKDGASASGNPGSTAPPTDPPPANDPTPRQYNSRVDALRAAAG
jgi:hypothetical protein